MKPERQVGPGLCGLKGLRDASGQCRGSTKCSEVEQGCGSRLCFQLANLVLQHHAPSDQSGWLEGVWAVMYPLFYSKIYVAYLLLSSFDVYEIIIIIKPRQTKKLNQNNSKRKPKLSLPMICSQGICLVWLLLCLVLCR